MLAPMSAPVTGDPLWAVLTPPQLARFRTITGVGDASLAVDFTGWNKYVMLDAERVFLFPRRSANVEWFERELAVYVALATADLPVVPRILGRFDDPGVYPYPFAAVARLPGAHPHDASELLGELGRAVARWHEMSPPELAGARRPKHHERPAMLWLHRALDPATAGAAAAEAADRLGCGEKLARWTEMLGIGARHRHVLVHGDIHEDQLLAVDGRLTGILDWETARVDHPFWDFDLGEWGTGLWRTHRRDFSRLWAIAWGAYASERGLDADPLPLETAFRIRHALALLDDADSSTAGDPAIVGTITAHLAAI